MTAATQLLFGSSPLTEPDDDFLVEGPGRSGDAALDDAVPSSQQSEREELVLEKGIALNASHMFEAMPQSPVEASLERYTEGKELRSADPGGAVPLEEIEPKDSPIGIPDIPTEKASVSKEVIIRNAGSQGVVETQGMGVAEVRRDQDMKLEQDQAMAVDQNPAVPVTHDQAVCEPIAQDLKTVAVAPNADQKKEITNDDEFDDEFDNDPWFDDACLKNFDAMEPMLQESARDSTVRPAVANSIAPKFSLFQTAGGGELPEVSEAAKVASAAILSQADGASNAIVTNIPAEEPVVDSFIDTRPVEQIQEHEIPTVVGFSTGRGRKVVISTQAAAAKNARVAKLMQELMDIKDEVEGDETRHTREGDRIDGAAPHQEKAASARPQMGSPGNSQAIFETPRKSGGSAFVTAGGTQLGGISASAKAAVSSIFDAEPEVIRERAGTASNEKPTASLFVTASGTVLPTPSAEARKATTALFEDSGADSVSHNAASSDYPLQPANPAILSLALPDTTFETPMKPASRPIVLDLHPVSMRTPAPSVSRPAGLHDISNLQPSSPAKQSHNGFKTPLPSKTSLRASQAKPFQTPLPSSRQRAMSPAASTSRGLSPALPRRVGLGMTPRARSGLGERPRFVSPFRTSVQDDSRDVPGSPIVKPKSGMRAIFSAPSSRKGAKVAENAPVLQSCFDLSCKPFLSKMIFECSDLTISLSGPTRRTTMIEAGLQPKAATSSAPDPGL